jgi:hypothetical protein
MKLSEYASDRSISTVENNIVILLDMVLMVKI